MPRQLFATMFHARVDSEFEVIKVETCDVDLLSSFFLCPMQSPLRFKRLRHCGRGDTGVPVSAMCARARYGLCQAGDVAARPRVHLKSKKIIVDHADADDR